MSEMRYYYLDGMANKIYIDKKFTKGLDKYEHCHFTNKKICQELNHNRYVKMKDTWMDWKNIEDIFHLGDEEVIASYNNVLDITDDSIYIYKHPVKDIKRHWLSFKEREPKPFINDWYNFIIEDFMLTKICNFTCKSSLELTVYRYDNSFAKVKCCDVCGIVPLDREFSFRQHFHCLANDKDKVIYNAKLKINEDIRKIPFKKLMEELKYHPIVMQNKIAECGFEEMFEEFGY